jgi:hypothetical protein
MNNLLICNLFTVFSFSLVLHKKMRNHNNNIKNYLSFLFFFFLNFCNKNIIFAVDVSRVG